jgi:hypothetical protein
MIGFCCTAKWHKEAQSYAKSLFIIFLLCVSLRKLCGITFFSYGFVVPPSGTKKRKVRKRVYLLFFYFVFLCGNSVQLCGITFFSYGFVVPPSGTKKHKVRKSEF